MASRHGFLFLLLLLLLLVFINVLDRSESMVLVMDVFESVVLLLLSHMMLNANFEMY